MNNRALFLVVATTLAVAGCDSKTAATPPKPPQVVQAPAPAAVPAPLTDAEKMALTAKKRADFKAKYPGGDMNCENGTCTVDVTVGPGCTITATPNPLGAQEGEGNLTIVWTIRTSGATYAGTNGASGISAKDAGVWGWQFSNPVPGATVFKWSDANRDTSATSYGYNISVMKGTTPCSVDPIIINGF
jgi:hypothetical protein